MIVAEDDLTIRILRDVQRELAVLREVQRELAGFKSEFRMRVSSLEEKAEVTNERLSLVERGVTFCAAQINVMRRHMGIEERKSDDEIRDLQARVAKLEDLVKP
jgi:hypothetical protein